MHAVPLVTRVRRFVKVALVHARIVIMTTWIIYALLGMLQLGLMMALLKVPAAKQINKYGLSAWSYLFSVIIAGAFLFQSIVPDLKTIMLSFFWGAGYAILTIYQMHLLHKHDTSGLFPFTSLASNVLVVVGGVLFLNEVITLVQWIAIYASVLLFIISNWNNKIHFVVEILPSFAFIALLSTFNKFIQKAGASSVETYNFIFWQLLFAFVASFIILLYKKRQTLVSDLTHRHLLKWALIIGVLQFGSTYTIVKSLSTGPISMVYIILGLYTFLTSMFAALLFKEKITRKALVVILCSFLIVILIKLGE